MATSPSQPVPAAPLPEHDPPPQSNINTWKPLGYFTSYRLILAGLLAVLQMIGKTPSPFGQYLPELYAWSCYGYVGFSLAMGLAVRQQRPSFQTQVYLQVIADIVFIILLLHASGGIDSGMGMLLVVSIAAGSMLTAGRTAGLFAALATIALLLEQSYLMVTAPPTLLRELINYPQAGMLGGALFATAALAHTLARRIRESEALAAQRGIDLANMAQLTDYIIQHMQAGVVAVDGEGRIRLINATASRLLTQPPATRQPLINTYAPELARCLHAWRNGTLAGDTVLYPANSGIGILPRFMATGSGHEAGTLIFLEDASATAREAQQLKLASLGRLTASIAHEIRNPLGAISHAGELLGESPAPGPEDRRLIEIILTQGKRINTIIESVLQLGRRDRSQPESIRLGPWLARFGEELADLLQITPGEIRILPAEEALEVRFDPNHLRQILLNLCQNGLRHAAGAPLPRVELGSGHTADGTIYLDIRDFGPGIAAEALPHIFEPFFTTEARGTGLGLYLARELADCNHAHLFHLPPEGSGARFRLLFPRQ